MCPSDVMCAPRVKVTLAEHITSLCGGAAIHHCELCEQHHCAEGTTSLYLSRFSNYNTSEGEVPTMSESKLRDLSMDFSVQIINLVKELKAKHELVISNQIGRSGTSIGANIYEANYAQGTKDFISKLEIALKEASETGYWLELLYRTDYIDEQTYKTLNDQCTSIRVMLIASCRTVKGKQQ